MMRTLQRLYYRLIKKSPIDFPMVQYWKTKDSVAAKITRNEKGSIYMQLEGERHPFPTFPRGHILFGRLSKLKHEIKNQIFNDSWWKLEEGKPRQEVIENIKRKFFGEIAGIAESMRYDMLPQESMCVSVKEIHRAWTKAGGNEKVRDIFTFIMQEDDGYRNRFQWLVNYFNPNSLWSRLFGDPIKQFEKALQMLEHAEVIGDMKERIRLVRRIILLLMEDKGIRDFFVKLCREIDWNKVKLSEADKFHFRGKYFKVDHPLIDY